MPVSSPPSLSPHTRTRAAHVVCATALWLFVPALQSSLLGGLLTVSPRLWYGMPAGELVPLRALEDQQLAGLLMWVPGGLLHAAAGLTLIGAWLRESGRRMRRVAGLCSDSPAAQRFG